ncbi:MAG: hypothetical protein JYX80_06855 [Candidatus Scalindua sediminis]|nr:hypothetical protein [Candidatus Scalindua sediminis]
MNYQDKWNTTTRFPVELYLDEMLTFDFRIYDMEKFKGSILIRKEMTKMNGKACGLTN